MTDTKDLYLDVMKKALTGLLWDDSRLWRPVDFSFPQPPLKRIATSAIRERLSRVGREICEPVVFDAETRKLGRDWPYLAHTMVGLLRLDNLQECVESVIRDQVPGDLIETGVWRGGASIFMRATLRAHGITDRAIWLADSFAGLPPPDVGKYPADKGDNLYTYDALRVSLEEVKENFRRYGLLDEQVHFLKGWFKDTLPTAPIKQLAVLRLDGDMYESTWDALSTLYPKLSAGGYAIIDDYMLAGCRSAVHDYRDRFGISAEIKDIDGTGVYWRHET